MASFSFPNGKEDSILGMHTHLSFKEDTNTCKGHLCGKKIACLQGKVIRATEKVQMLALENSMLVKQLFSLLLQKTHHGEINNSGWLQ